MLFRKFRTTQLVIDNRQRRVDVGAIEARFQRGDGTALFGPGGEYLGTPADLTSNDVGFDRPNTRAANGGSPVMIAPLPLAPSTEPSNQSDYRRRIKPPRIPFAACCFLLACVLQTAVAQAGFNACLLIEGNLSSNPYYHRAADSVDTPNYIDYAYAANMTRGVVGYLAENTLAVPEPSSFSLLVLAAIPLGLRRLRASGKTRCPAIEL